MGTRRVIIVVLIAAVSGCGEPTRVDVPNTHPANPDAAAAPTPPASSVLAIDPAPPAPPVQTSAAHASHADQTAAEPASEKDNSAPAQAAAYSCPMHPEVTSDKPGRCPKCGMQLKPTSAAKAP